MSLELNYKVFGEGEPVIILHGLFGMLDNWQTFAKKLAEDYMVYIIDHRDHGKSPHTDTFNYPVLAEDLQQFMEANWIHEARLIGHSMGGKTVMQFAAEYEDMVKQLVVVDIAPVSYKPGHNEIFEALLSVDIDYVNGRSDVEATLSNYISDVGVRLFLMKNLQRKKEGGYRWKMNLELLHKEYEHIIANVSKATVETNTLFVRGEKSKYIVEEGEAAIAEYYTNAEVKTVKGAGHWIHAEQPDILLEMVKTFFQE